jgi:cobalt-zinc-cadmium efflux system outer membrane protein
MRRRWSLIATVAVILMLTGCATVQTNKEWARVGDFAKERTGLEARWEQTAEDAQATNAEVAAMLADGLTREEAVRIALMNNRTLQVAFEELGVAKADLVQAGLFTNPRLDGLVRFPTPGKGTNVEAGGVINIADLWQIPIRKRLAATRMEATTLRVANELLETVAQAKQAYDASIALAAAKDETARLLKEMEALRDRIAYRQEHGFTSDFDLAFAQAAVFDQEAALARTEGELQVARAHLNRVLGLSPKQSEYELKGSLPDNFGPLPETEALIVRALAQRPDIQLAELEVAISERALALERTRILTDVEAGASYERDADGDDMVGPALGLHLPLFDQNQAQIAKASFRVRQAEKRRRALEGKVREEVAAAAEQYGVALKEFRLIRDKILPAYRNALEYAEKYYGAMQLNMLFLLEARKELYSSRRRYIDSLREALTAKVDIERALGGVLPSS